jgi:hypothetical protein
VQHVQILGSATYVNGEAAHGNVVAVRLVRIDDRCQRAGAEISSEKIVYGASFILGRDDKVYLVLCRMAR